MIAREPIFREGVRGRMLDFLESVGRATVLTAQAFAMGPAFFTDARFRSRTVSQMYKAGIRSLPLLTVVALFTGMILALQVGLELRRYSQEVFIGSAVMLSLLREMGPFMTGILITACVGSAIAAQIGTMSVNEEIAALETMAISPVRFLMAPRLAALATLMPLLSFYTCIVGLIGGGLVGVTQLNVPWEQYVENAMHFAELRDLLVGLFKAWVFGVVIAGISCHLGFATAYGAAGVGRTTRQTVIVSLLLILILGYIITRIFY